MADDIGYTPGTGATIAADDIGGVLYQRMKVSIGADGAGTDLSAANPMPVGGNLAHDAVDSGNPVKIGGKVNTSLPSSIASGDRSDAWMTSRGALVVGIQGTAAVPIDGTNASLPALATPDGTGTATYVGSYDLGFNGTTWDRVRTIAGLGSTDANTGILAVAQVPHKTGYTLASATAQYTTTQTSTTIGPTVSASQRMVVTSIQIQAGGTTAGAVQVYFGTGAYSRGTNLAVFDGEFAPSATSKPGYAQSPSVPYMGAADAELKVTTSAAVNPLTVTIWYYIVAV